ncbi:hypothetical protein DEW08_16795 [Azospirillum thermophilum]|uniref:Uncharacterized protein n=1 Tax=Azospirillum thermophilum TaxID=2202148 RepID=A0A2S2CT53_9PROT|nr:hypothetical protein DEW08_16795 [Azospirillum thermophilum]
MTLYGMAAEKLNLDVCLSVVIYPEHIQMAQKAGMSLRDWSAQRIDKALDLTAKEYGSRPDYLLIGEPHGKFEYDLAEVNDGRIGKRRGKAPSRKYDLHGAFGFTSKEIEKAFLQILRRQFKVRGLEQSKMVHDRPADPEKGGIPGWISYSAKHLEVTNTDNWPCPAEWCLRREAGPPERSP